MFLNRLQEGEKKDFLILAQYVARIDGNVSKDEQSIIKEYISEMQIEAIDFDENKFDIYNTLGSFQSKESKKIVLLEIMALIHSDTYIHEKEREVLKTILEDFDFSSALFVICEQWAKTMVSQFKQGNALIEL